MPLHAGTRVGGFEIVALVGAGGMGEVYRARDTRLNRDVALKTLSPRLSADADAIARFEREARALASLNHPNIAAIYDVVEHAGRPVLVLELVEGGTLADRLAIKPLSIADTIAYAKQIADGLDTAHEAGIVHRDLKPANIKITDHGQLKILDFGLAKAVAMAVGESPDSDPAASPTLTVHGTHAGVILGTAAYMSPEQARGKRIDKRTDIWAFGCVLFEMLTGTRPFDGETTSDVIAAILERSPDLKRLPAATPPHLSRIVARCLVKDPKSRLRDIGDIRHELEDRDTVAPSPARRSALMASALVAVAAIAAIGAAAALWQWRAGAPASPAAPIEFTFRAPAGYALAPVRSTVSPDGQYIAFVAVDVNQVRALFLRSLQTGSSRRVDGTEGIEGAPFWSPDGKSIAFMSGNVWRRIGVDGGPAVAIARNIVSNLGASWGPGDVFLVAPANRASLSRVAISGGSLQPATILDAEKENSHRWPQWLPDGRHFLFTVRSDAAERLGIKVGSIDGGDTRVLVNAASQGVYTRPGWLLYVTPDRALVAQRLDPATWTLQEAPRPIAGPVRYNGPSFNGMFDASFDGSVLTYAPGTRQAATLEWFDRTGKSLGRVGDERPYMSVRLAPNGRLAAVDLPDQNVGTRDIWMLDIATQALTRLTSHPATDWRSAISPDGSTIAFASDRAGASSIFVASASSPGSERPLLRIPGTGVFPTDWSRAGTHLFVSGDTVEGRPRQLLMVPLAGGPPVTLVSTPAADIGMPRVSPDGERVAFLSNESGAVELYIMSIRDHQRVKVSNGGGTNPIWGPDGKELFFQSRQGELMRVVLNGTAVARRAEAMFRMCDSVNRTFNADATEYRYDIDADGSKFLAICDPLDSTPSEISVVVNWQSRLR